MSKILMKEEQKQIAIKRLEQLKIYKPYVQKFRKKQTIVTVFENYGGFYVTADNGFSKLEEKIKSFEDETGSLVYAVTHECFEFGECYSFLIVSKYAEDEEDIFIPEDNDNFYPFAYVWNSSYEDCSEFGTIGVQSRGGGLKRVE